jgi:UDPglucose 6-dehydrogenase
MFDQNEKIGIIGMGFVGSAIHNVLDDGTIINLTIIDPAKGHNSTYQDIKNTEAVFVCVPTPGLENGNCDTSILEDVLAKLAEVDYEGVIISKCTAPPATYELLNKKYKNLVHVPEFLTAANASRDLLNSTFAIIGGDVPAYRREAERFVKFTQPALKDIRYTSIGEAALTKYVINSYLATKVVFMNEIAKLAEAMGYEYDEIHRLVRMDERIGLSHTCVPGKDGTYGFGGHCFPKDTAALLSMSRELNTTMQVLEAAIKKNTFLRLS